MSFDIEPGGDPHGECALEIKLLNSRIEKLRYALKFYAGQARDAEWEGCKFLTFDKFGGLSKEIAGPYVATHALKDDLETDERVTA